jgi:hypothetical protein
VNALYNEMEGAKLKMSVEQDVTIVKEPDIKLHVNKVKVKVRTITGYEDPERE